MHRPSSGFTQVGQDPVGEMTRENLATLNVDTTFLLSKPGKRSGVAQICVSTATGLNSIIVVPGANLAVRPEDVAAASHVICNSKVLLLQNEIAPVTTLACMKIAKGTTASSSSSNPLVVLNAAPAPSVGVNWRQGMWEDIKEMIGQCDILCVNESETEKLTGLRIETCREIEEHMLLEAVLAGAAKLLQLGAPQVLYVCVCLCARV